MTRVKKQNCYNCIKSKKSAKKYVIVFRTVKAFIIPPTYEVCGGYIVFAFPFVCSFVRTFVRTFVRLSVTGSRFLR